MNPSPKISGKRPKATPKRKATAPTKPAKHGKEWKGNLNPFGHDHVLGEKKTRVPYQVLWDVYKPRPFLNEVLIETEDKKTGKKTSRLDKQWAAGNGIAGAVTKLVKTTVKSVLPMNPKK